MFVCLCDVLSSSVQMTNKEVDMIIQNILPYKTIDLFRFVHLPDVFQPFIRYSKISYALMSCWELKGVVTADLAQWGSCGSCTGL